MRPHSGRRIPGRPHHLLPTAQPASPAPDICETVNLGRLLSQVQHDLEPLTRGRAVTWEIGKLSDARVAALLYQAFLEVLAFALENSWNHLEPCISALTPDGHVVTIWNNGEGGPAAAQDRLFEVLDRSVMRRTALGRLGMSNVRWVIARHGGWVRASSPPEGAWPLC